MDGAVEKLLKRFNMDDCKPVETPVDVSCKLVKATDEEVNMDQQLYQSAVGSLMYCQCEYYICSKQFGKQADSRSTGRQSRGY